MSRVDFTICKTSVWKTCCRSFWKRLTAPAKNRGKIGNEERVEFLNSLLWTYNDTSFLPHGSRKDGFADMQPIWLTAGDDVPNGAEFLFLTDGARTDWETISRFEGYSTSLTAIRKKA